MTIRRIAIAALTAALGTAAVALAAPGDDVVVIGDSLGVGMEPYLAADLGEYEIRTDAVIGRGSAAGVDALEANLTPDAEVIVFALGSNDDPSQPAVLADSLEAAGELAGGRCLVVATLEVSALTGVSERPLNDVIRSFAAANPSVRLVEWQRAITPDLLTDGGHATPEGYELRAALFADAIESCDGAVAAAATDRDRDGIPSTDRDGLDERRDRPDPAPRQPEPIGRAEAIQILADALSSQVAIGALGGTG